MNHISNTIEVEYAYYRLEVDYNWRKGNAGDYFNPPDPNETDIKKVILTGFINDDGSIEDLNIDLTERINYNCPYLPKNLELNIFEEIEFDVESLM